MCRISNFCDDFEGEDTGQITDCYVYGVEDVDNDIHYRIRDAIESGNDKVQYKVDISGLDNMEEGHLNAIFEQEILKKDVGDLPKLKKVHL